MYLNPFVAGVLTTILVELILFFTWLVVSSHKEE